MSARFDLAPLLSPQAIAVVGASDRPGAGSIVLSNLRQLGYSGAVYPVNPRYQSLQGWPCYPSLAALPGPIDCSAVLLSAGQVLPALEQAVQAGARSAWLLASGFAEAGPAGQALQDELVAFAHRHHMPICGPNCVGVVNLRARSATYSVELAGTLRPGPVAAVVQSGAICLGLANANRGPGFSTLISSGNEAVLDNADYIDYLVDDPATRVIIAFIEGFKNPSRFVDVASRARAAGKPLLVVKVGRSAVAQRATLAHTGSLAGADAVHDAVFRRHGVVRLDSLDELLEAAELFTKAPLPQGRGLALLTLSGGQIGLIGDALEGLALDLPELSAEARQALAAILPPYSPVANPLDAWGSGNFEETVPACAAIVARETQVHLVAIARDSAPGIASREVWQSQVIVDAAARVAEMHAKPVVVFSNLSTGVNPEVRAHADVLGLPLLQGTRTSLRALQALADYAEQRRRPACTQPVSPVPPDRLPTLRTWLAGQPPSLVEHRAKELLAAYGISVTSEWLATSPQEAAELAARLPGPVVLKISSPDIQHKTEAGGVRLYVFGEAAVRQAYAEIIAAARVYNPQACLDGVLVQEMVSASAIEVIAGTHNDPDFGPVVVFGTGGILVELLHDVALRLAPVDREEAMAMVAGTRASLLLRGFRGRPPADIAAVVDALVRLSHLAYDLRDEIAAIDINPLMVLPAGEGVRAADALILRTTGPDGSFDA